MWYKYSFIFLFAALILGCEKEVEVEVNEGQSQLVVDAFLSNLETPQKITLKQSIPFFSSDKSVPVLGADIEVEDNEGNIYEFEDEDGNGEYIWGDGSQIMVEEGRTYELKIEYNGFSYTASSFANPVPQIDSINFEFVEGQFGGEDTYITELVVIDLPGRTDYYWIKSFSNGILYDQLEGLNISVDGSLLGENSGNDGQPFIPPVSTFAAQDPDNPLGVGDVRRFELWSITRETYRFWLEVANQDVGSGIAALFATPLANVRSNFTSNAEESADQAVGWFSVSVVSSEEIEITDDPDSRVSFTDEL